MRPNDRGTESRLGMGHRGLDEEGENIAGRRNSVRKSTKVPSHLAPVRAGERPVARKQKAGARVFGVELEVGCTSQVLASFIGDGRGCFLSVRQREKVIWVLSRTRMRSDVHF